MNNHPKKTSSSSRLIGMLFKQYPVHLLFVVICILIASITSAAPDIILKRVIDTIQEFIPDANWSGAFRKIISYIIILVVLSIIGILASFVYTQLMASVTQGFLYDLRKLMFDKMQNLPISYFDKNKTGDIMSHYTNDVDSVRQLISQSIPALIRTIATLIFIFIVMIRFSIWLTLVLFLGVFAMSFVLKRIGGKSAKYFFRQQESLGQTEAFIQEIMNGQKVVKVFNHEKMVMEQFDKVNDKLADDSYKANAFANILMPIINNIGNISYVLVAVAGSVLLLFNVPNLSISKSAFTLGIAVSFLNITKQFTGNINQVSGQINSIVMGFAGVKRVFDLIDENVEVDDGYVKLVNCTVKENGEIIESDKRTGKWAWKDILGDGSIEYTLLQGDVRFKEVDFEYEENKKVLEGINLYAMPGQKIAFVGATGAGKTTITNLINRFYDVADGKIQYDHININRIRKEDLRKSLAVVLQDTNLFTGTVMENIRYGKLDATDEECISAAKLSGADSFIKRLPHGYDTLLNANGDNLSQGQRQLLSIARAAVCDPPVMILDEATSSIDTHTEKLVQEGMDRLMKGRTVFVIAHRLSTVMNSDVIMVLDHGKIIERGNHEELINQKGIYYKLYTGAFELE